MEQQSLFVQMGLNSWNTQLDRAEKLFSRYSDEEFYMPVAPGKNRIIYLYGHLAVVHDALKELLGLGKLNRPDLYAIFLENPDKANAGMPSVGELKAYWKSVHDELRGLFSALPPAEWLKRHNSMTDEDFEKEPYRNRLSVLITRAGHIAYHLGQVALVNPVNG